MKPNVKGFILAISVVVILWIFQFINYYTIKNSIVECILAICISTTCVFSNKFECLFKPKELNDKKSRRIQ